MLINPEGSSLLHFLALCGIMRRKNFFRKFQVFRKKNVSRFLSLRYSADFRRSRLVGSWQGGVGLGVIMKYVDYDLKMAETFRRVLLYPFVF